MCEIARTVPGVYGERMLGGGDKGASGAIVASGSVGTLAREVDTAYPSLFPDMRGKYAVHALKIVEGIRVLGGLL
jgi:galactokinase